MAVTHKNINIILRSADETITRTITVGGDNYISNNLALAASAIDTVYTVTLPAIGNVLDPKLQFALIGSDQNIIVKTNDTGDYDDIYTIKAYAPLLWWLEQDGAFAGYTDQNGNRGSTPFFAGVTKFYVTNLSAVAGTVYFRFYTNN